MSVADVEVTKLLTSFPVGFNYFEVTRDIPVIVPDLVI